MKPLKKNQRGAVLLTVALFLTLLLAFTALGIEAGRWYLVRAELSKSVDAGALAGAKNISNPYVDPRTLAAEFTAENFPNGSLGTPGSGTGSANFTVQQLDNGRIQVDGHASVMSFLAQVVGFNQVPVSSMGVAQKRPVEIMLVLDRSGSMQGQPIADLKVAAKSFLDFFADTQNQDKVGLVSFATSVKVERALGTGFVTPMKTAISGMVASGHTNAEDALDQADGPGGFTNQNGVPADARVQQFLIFFSDGRPNAIRWTFKNRGATYDAVAFCDGNCDPGDFNTTNAALWRPDREAQLNVPARPTGDGVYPGSRCGASKVTTRWNIFDTRPIPGLPADACSASDPTLGDHVCDLASELAVLHAGEMKDKGVIAYSIGLGTRINNEFLEAVATSPQQVYMAPTSAELAAIFQRVAQDIKLRLVQ
jgi:Mg-chelatase subunit ChlD